MTRRLLFTRGGYETNGLNCYPYSGKNPRRRQGIRRSWLLAYWRSAIALEIGGKPAQILAWNRGRPGFEQHEESMPCLPTGNSCFAKQCQGARTHMQPRSRPKQKILFDAALILMAVTLLALSMPAAEQAVSGKQADPSAYVGFYIIYLGLLFLLSYFYSHASYVLGALMWACEHFSYPRGRLMAVFYFFLSLLVGLWALLAAFRVI
jgi:hypothetical protein